MSLMMTNFCSNSGSSNCAGLINSLNSSCSSQQTDPYHGQPPEWATQLTQFVALKRDVFNLPSVVFQVANQTAKPLMTLPRISRNITKVIKRNISLSYEKALRWSHPFFLCTAEQPQQPSGLVKPSVNQVQANFSFKDQMADILGLWAIWSLLKLICSPIV